MPDRGVIWRSVIRAAKRYQRGERTIERVSDENDEPRAGLCYLDFPSTEQEGLATGVRDLEFARRDKDKREEHGRKNTRYSILNRKDDAVFTYYTCMA